MEELVFATVLKGVKAAFADRGIADPDLINLFYNTIALPANLSNKTGSTITVDKGRASKIMNREKGGNAHRVICTYSNKANVTMEIAKSFRERIVSRLNTEAVDDLLAGLTQVIQNDKQIADAKKEELLALANKDNLAEFLSGCYLYSLTRDNVLHAPKPKTQEEIDRAKRSPLEKIDIPEEPTTEEKRYIDALMDVFAQAKKDELLSSADLDAYPELKTQYNAHRGYYYAAEAVRRGIRDMYSNEEQDQFSILLDDAYEGVIEVWEDHYKNGLERLRQVMIQASRMTVDNCWLSHETAWIGNLQKKGACHFLVNRGRLNGWVRSDDEQSAI